MQVKVFFVNMFNNTAKTHSELISKTFYSALLPPIEIILSLWITNHIFQPYRIADNPAKKQCRSSFHLPPFRILNSRHPILYECKNFIGVNSEYDYWRLRIGNVVAIPWLS